MQVVQMLSDRMFHLMPDWQHEFMRVIKETSMLQDRSRKYDKIVAALYFAACCNPLARFFPGRPAGIAPPALVGYFVCRILDDLADGDRELPSEYTSFSELGAGLKRAMLTNEYPDTDIGILLRGLVRDMQDYRGVCVKDSLSQFIDAMSDDHDRRVNRIVSTRDQLEQIYSNSFRTPQNLAFIGFGSPLRSEQVPELAQLQGRVYAVRDLHSELPKGVICVPREVLESGQSLEDWAEEEIQIGRSLCEKLNSRQIDWRGRMITKFLIAGIRSYITHVSTSGFDFHTRETFKKGYLI